MSPTLPDRGGGNDERSYAAGFLRKETIGRADKNLQFSKVLNQPTGASEDLV